MFREEEITVGTIATSERNPAPTNVMRVITFSR
jgi:hypothetical protein